MEQLKYIIEDRTIAYLLGINNFTNDESAILELVKNAYDANAFEVKLTFSGNDLVIIDDGVGMSENEIRNNWMHVGKSEKKYETLDKENKRRILSGSKGVGRFALARLGESIEIHSKKSGFPSILWKTNWNTSSLMITNEYNNQGTKIIINKLREKWGKKKVQNLISFLSKTYNDKSMKIFITHPEISGEIKEYFPIPKVGINCLSTINTKYDSRNCKLYTTVQSDEFLSDAQLYCSNIDINHLRVETDMLDELESVDKELSKDELRCYLEELGDFSAQFYFYLKPTNDDVEKFMYKHSGLIDALPGGVVLYRNAFSISAYEGKKDWLDFGKRARKSPAAASHPTGSWRVRENQIAGKVEIDKKENQFLIDLSNRQGLEENFYLQLFIKIIHTSINEFERYRQSIIRSINIKNEKEKQDISTPITDKMIANPKIVTNLSDIEVKQLVDEIKSYRKQNKNAKIEMETVEERYKYDVRILNVLATIGLKASSIAHEMRNDRNSIDTNTKHIIKALKAYDMWDELNTPEKTKRIYKNIPYLLESNNNVTKKIVAFMNAMLSEIEKRQFELKIQNISEILNRIKSDWEKDYVWIKINLNIKNDLECCISEDIIQVIIDNLVLNSIQQNEKDNNLVINITIKKIGELISFVYEDNGKGLDKKYQNNPRKILEVHETTREKGHGLGMWIVNNTVNMSGGNIDRILGNNGFLIEFTIGGAL